MISIQHDVMQGETCKTSTRLRRWKEQQRSAKVVENINNIKKIPRYLILVF